ncbi:MAG TPA: sigma-70 family RNA polymerase sigma factor [Puia sp.]|nr:sigma-70 family RNA polymerase sigma factor [Puia sp.]
MEKDRDILAGLQSGPRNRASWEIQFYHRYEYFIGQGCRKFHLSTEDSFSAYSDAVLSAIHNIAAGRFDGASSLKTYLFRIFSNKCIDQIRKNAMNKATVHHSVDAPEDLLAQLPDKSRSAVELLIHRNKIETLRENMQKLGEKCRELLLLFEDGFSDKDIAEKMDYNSPAVVKTTRLRCIQSLRDLMKHSLKTI